MGKSCCSCKLACCICCSCFCLILISLGIVAIVLYNAFEEPVVDYVDSYFKKVTVKRNAANVPNEVQLSMDIELRLDNPSRPPIGATVKDIKTEAFSLDRTAADKVGKPILLGYANIDGILKIEPESVTNFNLTMITTSETAKDPDFVSRFTKDCNTGEKVTKMRVHIKEVTVDVFGSDVILTPGVESDFEMNCSSAMASSSETSVSNPGAPPNPSSGLPAAP